MSSQAVSLQNVGIQFNHVQSSSSSQSTARKIYKFLKPPESLRVMGFLLGTVGVVTLTFDDNPDHCSVRVIVLATSWGCFAASELIKVIDKLIISPATLFPHPPDPSANV